MGNFKNLSLFVFLGFLSIGCHSKGRQSNECTLSVSTTSNLPSCINNKNVSSVKLLFEWLYYNDEERGSLENDIILLDRFKSKMLIQDYLFYKAEIYIAHDNSNKAIKLYIKSDDLGNPDAGEALYRIFYIKDKNLAFKYLESSSQKGNSIAKFVIGGKLFEEKDNVDANKGLAIRNYELSAMKGESQALLRLMDKEVFELMDEKQKSYWSLVYYLFEKEKIEFKKELLSNIQDWDYFCKKFSEFEPHDGLDGKSVDFIKYRYFKRIILNCF